MNDETLYHVSDVAREVNRVPHTIRMWDEILPKDLRPSRDSRGWRVWTWSQIEGIKEWIADTDRRPGKGLEQSRHVLYASGGIVAYSVFRDIIDVGLIRWEEV